MREKYNDGVLHKLKLNQEAKKGSFEIKENFIINLNQALTQWFSVIIKNKIKNKKKPIIYYYDIWGFSIELKKILQKMKFNRDERRLK